MINLRHGNVLLKKKKKKSPVESRLLDTHQNYRLLSMEIESDSIHHARFNTEACMCCTHTHTHTRTHTLMHPNIHTQASFIYSNIKLTECLLYTLCALSYSRT